MTRYTAILEYEDNVGFGVYFPELPGCAAMGNTADEAIINATAALCDWAFEVEHLPKPAKTETLAKNPEVSQALREGKSFVSIPLISPGGKSVRLNTTIDEGVLATIDSEATRHGLTRSAMIEKMASNIALLG